MAGTGALRAILWDMDGTLIDSEPAWIRAQGSMVEAAGGAWTLEDGLALVGADMPATAAAMRRAGLDMDDDEIVRRLIAEVIDGLRRRIEWRPGALGLMAAVQAAGLPQAIVTTSPREMAQIVADALPGGAIKLIVSGDDVSISKPHPEPYLMAMSQLGVEPGGCVALEDSPTGLASAIAAGTVAVGIPNDAELGEPDGWCLLETLDGVTVEDLVRLVATH